MIGFGLAPREERELVFLFSLLFLSLPFIFIFKFFFSFCSSKKISLLFAYLFGAYNIQKKKKKKKYPDPKTTLTDILHLLLRVNNLCSLRVPFLEWALFPFLFGQS